MRRKVYVQFRCSNYQDEKGKQKTWTSILGNFELSFLSIKITITEIIKIKVIDKRNKNDCYGA